MADHYELVIRTRPMMRLRQMSDLARRDPDGAPAEAWAIAFTALEALRTGRETDHLGERLGFSSNYSDLRDCAEIKVPLVQEFKRDGAPRGPSHRMIYREFEPLPGDSLPVREIVGFGPRARGQVFNETANDLGRRRGVRVATLQDIPSVAPALGPNKDPSRPKSPARLPLPPDVAAVLQTTVQGRTKPRRPSMSGGFGSACPIGHRARDALRGYTHLSEPSP